ncbi:uncharacterized protein LOC105208763 [Zeugodacus cucurbitae]|nr:uncharacterized protein LOC105208763 [Zeugodacus cucurbitae]
MLKTSTSRETAIKAEAQAPNSCNESNNSVQMGKEIDENSMHRRSSSRKYDRHDAGHYEDNMSEDESDDSADRKMTTTRKSRKIQPTDAYDYDGGVSDCSHCRKHRMARARRNRRRKSRSRSRRRRR